MEKPESSGGAEAPKSATENITRPLSRANASTGLRTSTPVTDGGSCVTRVTLPCSASSQAADAGGQPSVTYHESFAVSNVSPLGGVQDFGRGYERGEGGRGGGGIYGSAADADTIGANFPRIGGGPAPLSTVRPPSIPSMMAGPTGVGMGGKGSTGDGGGWVGGVGGFGGGGGGGRKASMGNGNVSLGNEGVERGRGERGRGGNGFGARRERGGPNGSVADERVDNDDWEVLKGRGADGASVGMNLSVQHSLSHKSVVCCVRYSWDGRYLATGSNRSAHIYDAATGQNVAKLIEPEPKSVNDDVHVADCYVRAVCFSPDGNWLITGAEDHVVKVWDVRNRTVKHKLVGHTTDIYSVDASANGRFLISGSGDKKAKLWNLSTGALLSTLGDGLGPTDGITSVSVSPTSQHVAAGSLDKIVRVWDVETSELVRQFEGHKDSVYSVALSPDGQMLLSGSLDKTMKLWDLRAAQPALQYRQSYMGHEDFVLSVTFSPDGRWLISGSRDRMVQFWDSRQSTMCFALQGHKNAVISIAHSPVTNCVATGSGDCRARAWVYDYNL